MMYKLLIIDDEPVILEGMLKIIDWKEYGFDEIRTASTLEEGLEKAIIMQPDICLCDVCLKERRIYDLIETLEKTGGGSNYIIMSGYSDFAYAQQAIHWGAVDYLLKPVDAEKLREAVEKIIVTRLGGTIKKQNEEGMDPVLKKSYDEYSTLVGKILRFVGTDYAGEMTLKRLGEKFYMNSAYLGQIFQQETGMKFTEYVTAFRMNKAYWLIENTNDKISAIAVSVGYSNMSYFYTQFKTSFDISPKDIRK